MDLLEGYGSGEEEDEAEKKTLRNDEETDNQKHPRKGVVHIVPPGTTALSTLFVRSVPHKRGNWAGHVFLPVVGKTKEMQQKWQGMARASMERFRQSLERAGWSGPMVSHVGTDTQNNELTVSALHVSLSRPFYLQLASIESFVKQLRQRMACERKTLLTVQKEKLMVNENGSRSFWCWTMSSTPALHRLVLHVDAVLREYKQPTYYDPPEFHISIASVPGNVETLLNDSWRLGGECANDGVESEEENGEIEAEYHDLPLHIPVATIGCSFGTTKTYNIDLV